MFKYRPVFLAAAFALLAIAQLRAQSIVGAWTYGDTASPTSAGTGVFVFLANGVYFHAESENTADAANGTDGMERGTYTWNSSSGAFTASTIVNTNGGWGLSEGAPATITVTGNTMDVDGFTLNRVTGSTAIVGAWTFGNTASPTATGTGVVVFLDNGVYFHAESENTADALNGSNGMERGTYLWNPTTGAFSATTTVNTNGEWGFSNDVPATISISGSTMDIEGTTLTQVSAVPEPSTYAALAGVAALGLAIWRRRRTQTVG